MNIKLEIYYKSFNISHSHPKEYNQAIGLDIYQKRNKALIYVKCHNGLDAIAY